MKILYVSGALLSSKTGDTEHVLHVSRQMAMQAAQVHLVAVADTDTRQYAEPATGLQVHPVGRSRFGPVHTLLAVAREARRLVDELAPDMVYVRPFPLDWPLLLRGLARRGVPYVCELNTMIADEYRSLGQPLKGRLYEWFYARSIRSATAILPVTSEIGRWAERIAGVTKPAMMAGNGVEPDRLPALSTEAREQARRRFGVGVQQRIFAIAGFASPWHGFDRAIAMLPHLDPAVSLWLIGAESERAETEVRAVAERVGVQSRVQVFPRLDPAAVAERLVAADVGLGPLALDRKGMAEAQPIKVRLYLALGLPVLYNYVDPRLDAALPFLGHVDSARPEDLAAAAARLLERSVGQHDAARAFALQRLTWSTIAGETRQFLAGLVRPPTR